MWAAGTVPGWGGGRSSRQPARRPRGEKQGRIPGALQNPVHAGRADGTLSSLRRGRGQHLEAEPSRASVRTWAANTPCTTPLEKGSAGSLNETHAWFAVKTFILQQLSLS